jgi:enamine deaminase RidA (YjgF/YER057c/UK114 family)
LYAAAVVHGRLAISAGMTPREHGRLVVVGTVGDEVSVEVASAAAGLAAANALSAIADSVGGIGNISQCLRMTVYVACRPGFTSLSAVADGASARLHDLLGERAMAARSAIGVASLPSGAPIEVELMAAVSAS